jgi:hypothetical protein
MTYSQETKIDNLVNELTGLELNNLYITLDFSDKRDILKAAQRNCKINNQLIKSGDRDPVIELHLKKDDELSYFAVRPSKSKNTNYYLKIELIKFFYMDHAQAKEFINN